MSGEPWRTLGQRQASTIAATATVQAAATVLERERTHVLVVCEEGRPIGLVTAADLVGRVLAKGLSAERTRADAVMTRDVVVVPDDLPALDLALIMGERGVDCLPLVGPDGKLTAVLLLEDLLRFFLHGLDSLSRAMLKRASARA